MAKKKRDTMYIGNQWELLHSMLSGMYLEIDKLCKKKPDMLLSDLKIEKINELILPIKKFLQDENPFVARIQSLDKEEPMELSDVIILLSQLSKGLDAYKSKYYIDVACSPLYSTVSGFFSSKL